MRNTVAKRIRSISRMVSKSENDVATELRTRTKILPVERKTLDYSTEFRTLEKTSTKFLSKAIKKVFNRTQRDDKNLFFTVLNADVSRILTSHA